MTSEFSSQCFPAICPASNLVEFMSSLNDFTTEPIFLISYQHLVLQASEVVVCWEVLDRICLKDGNCVLTLRHGYWTLDRHTGRDDSKDQQGFRPVALYGHWAATDIKNIVSVLNATLLQFALSDNEDRWCPI